MEETKAANGNRKRIALVVFVMTGILVAIALSYYLRYKAAHISTDDAFIDGTKYTVASKVPGTIKAVHVKDNQPVKKGDLLIELGTDDYAVKVTELSAASDAERKRSSEIDARIEASKKQLAESMAKADAVTAMLELQKANFEQAENDMKRAEGLYKKEAISKEKYEKNSTALKVATAQVKAAYEGLRNVQYSVDTQKSLIKQAEAAKATQLSTIKQKEAMQKEAELKYGYLRIYASADGYVTKKSVEPGNQIQAGQPLMAIVALEDIYVTANYKETQLEKIKPGQKVKIEVDTYPGKVFWGRVESIMAGTGTTFSLFPPENAAGNYVKVVQRVPVKILLDKDTDRQHVLRVGMSVEPTVIIEKQ